MVKTLSWLMLLCSVPMFLAATLLVVRIVFGQQPSLSLALVASGGLVVVTGLGLVVYRLEHSKKK